MDNISDILLDWYARHGRDRRRRASVRWDGELGQGVLGASGRPFDQFGLPAHSV